ncbi:MAG TPA: hypothetical protein VJY62_09805 [Bacteroidia bacterium]|nr:hypothetical protein [Bacteroidia bacterium]
MKKNQTILLITVVLLAIAGYFIANSRKGTIREELKNFAVADTAAISKIFIADKFGHAVSVERVNAGKWTVNGKSPARQDAINTLLLTMKNMEVRSPVAKAAYNTIMKELSAKGRKVEIYQNGKLFKTYYVGSATQDMLGTFMYLENSSVPFVLFIPGFDGYLTTRFILDEDEWKQHLVFDVGIENISSVISQDMEQPQNSIMITRQSNGDFLLSNYSDKSPVAGAEQNKIQHYMAGFTNLNYEVESRSSKEYLDSIKSAGPFRILTVTDTKNKTTSVKMFRMPVTEKSKGMYENAAGEQMQFDPDKMFAQVNNESGLKVLQYYAFGKFFKKPSDFLITPAAKNNK